MRRPEFLLKIAIPAALGIYTGISLSTDPVWLRIASGVVTLVVASLFARIVCGMIRLAVIRVSNKS